MLQDQVVCDGDAIDEDVDEVRDRGGVASLL